MQITNNNKETVVDEAIRLNKSDFISKILDHAIDRLSQVQLNQLLLYLLKKQDFTNASKIVNHANFTVEHDRIDAETQKTALHFAIEHNQTEITRKLCEKGALFDKKDRNDKTPLQHALRQDRIQHLDILLNYPSRISTEQITQMLYFLIETNDVER